MNTDTSAKPRCDCVARHLSAETREISSPFHCSQLLPISALFQIHRRQNSRMYSMKGQVRRKKLGTYMKVSVMSREGYHCPVEATLDVIGGKWKVVILFHLTQDGTHRFA